jgi:hypothetical protein
VDGEEQVVGVDLGLDPLEAPVGACREEVARVGRPLAKLA